MGIFKKIFRKRKKKKQKKEKQIEISKPTNFRHDSGYSGFTQPLLTENKRFENRNLSDNDVCNKFDLRNQSHASNKSCYSLPRRQNSFDFKQPVVINSGLYQNPNENAYSHRYTERVDENRQSNEVLNPYCKTEMNAPNYGGYLGNHHRLVKNKHVLEENSYQRHGTNAVKRFEDGPRLNHNLLHQSNHDLSRQTTTLDDFLTGNSRSEFGTPPNVKMRQRHCSGPERYSICYDDYKDHHISRNKYKHSVQDINRSTSCQQNYLKNSNFQFPPKPPTYEDSWYDRPETINRSNNLNISRSSLCEDTVQHVKIPVENVLENNRTNQPFVESKNTFCKTHSSNTFADQRQRIKDCEKSICEIRQKLPEKPYVNQNNTNHNVYNCTTSSDQFSKFSHVNESKSEHLTDEEDFPKVNFEQLQKLCRERNYKINKTCLLGAGGLARVFTGRCI